MKYRKKPVIIEAIKFEYTENSIKKLKEFCGSSLGEIKKARSPNAKAEAQIMTLEDGKEYFVVAHVATEGDYIIKGIQGEFYACKPDIFEQTYEAIDV